jgi:hypothetical protein
VLSKGGAPFADKCKDGGSEPPSCDPGDHVEAILALSHGVNDQQRDPGSAEAIDLDTLRYQYKCQNLFGKAAMTFAFKRLKLVAKRCVEGNLTPWTAAKTRARNRSLSSTRSTDAG